MSVSAALRLIVAVRGMVGLVRFETLSFRGLNSNAGAQSGRTKAFGAEYGIRDIRLRLERVRSWPTGLAVSEISTWDPGSTQPSGFPRLQFRVTIPNLFPTI